MRLQTPPMPSSHNQAVAEEQTSAQHPRACPRALARPSPPPLYSLPLGQAGNLDHRAIVILPLIRGGLFQLRQQTLAERRCVTT